MANLFDTIQQNNPALQQQGDSNQTGQIQGLLRAKSGKAVSGPDTAASNLGEQAAVSQGNNQLVNQVGTQASIQNQGQKQQASAQQQQFGEQAQQIAQQRNFDTVQTRIKTNQILQNLEQSKGQIDMARQRSEVEQVGTNLRLQDQNYVNQLQREGNLARLQDEGNFQQALQSTILGGNQQLLEKQLGDRSVLDANENQFKQALARMDISTAWDFFKNDAAQQQQRALYSGAGAITTAGVGAYGKLSQQKKDKKDNSGTTDTGDTSANTGIVGDVDTGDAGATV